MRIPRSALVSVALLLPGSAHGAQRVQASASGPHQPGCFERTLPAPPPRVLQEVKISNLAGGFPDSLDNGDEFGHSIAPLGDVDGDGVTDLAVSFRGDTFTVDEIGGLWVLFLRSDGTVREQRRIDGVQGGFGGAVDVSDLFGWRVASPGDLDGDGVPEVAVSAIFDDDVGVSSLSNSGAVWILFLNADGSVRDWQKISATQGGFGAGLEEDDRLGTALCALGDLDGDGIGDLAVGANQDDDGGLNRFAERGAVYLLFLNADGTVKGKAKISQESGGFGGALDDRDFFGSSLATLGDLDGNGVVDLAVGALGDDDGGDFRGAIWVLFLQADGSVLAEQKLSDLAGNFTGVLRNGDGFGFALAGIGDLDGDGTPDLAAGAPDDDNGGQNRGAYWVLFLNPDGTCHGQAKVSDTVGNFSGVLANQDGLGSGLALLGDLDGDGFRELAVSAPRDDQGGNGNGSERGAVWVMSMRVTGGVLRHQKIADGSGGFRRSTLETNSGLGSSLVAVGDLDGDGVIDLASGTPADGDGQTFNGLLGAFWTFFLEPDGSVRAWQKVSATQGGMTGLDDGDLFGTALAPLGDVDGDGVPDLAVGAPGSDLNRGRVWILLLAADGTVKSAHAIGNALGGLGSVLERDDRFGSAVAQIDDLDGDGRPELAVGASTSGNLAGALWILFLDEALDVRSARRIGPGAGGFVGPVSARANLGRALAGLGDLDGDGKPELAVGAPGESEGGTPFSSIGAVWILSLETDGSVASEQKINGVQGGFGGELSPNDFFGLALGTPGDLDGDGRTELVVCAPGDDDGGNDVGAAWMLFLAPDGTVRAEEKIGAGLGGFGGELHPGDGFGRGLAPLGDLDGDGVLDLLVGAPGDDDGGENHGALWLLGLDGIATLDFETRDDYARTPIRNGEAVRSPQHFGRSVALASSGANLGTATFDSTPAGPNDPSQDRDLLVGLGNLLILQNSQAPVQSVAGIYDRPNDDQDGGEIVLSFPRPVQLHALDLVDIDSGSTQHATVTLVDGALRTRVYSVPMGWTEDLLNDGPTGWRTLDLVTLDPQPGFHSTATAVQSPGFDARGVIRLHVMLGSSGAIDNVRWDPNPAQ